MDFLLNVVARFSSGDTLSMKMSLSILIVNMSVPPVPGSSTIRIHDPIIRVDSLLLAGSGNLYYDINVLPLTNQELSLRGFHKFCIFVVPP